MFYILLAALLMMFLGSVFLSDKWARENMWLYIFYWLICAWLTVTALILAAFDILLIRAANRARKRLLEAELLRETVKPPDKP
jgi:hypothetical protein